MLITIIILVSHFAFYTQMIKLDVKNSGKKEVVRGEKGDKEGKLTQSKMERKGEEQGIHVFHEFMFFCMFQNTMANC